MARGKGSKTEKRVPRKTIYRGRGMSRFEKHTKKIVQTLKLKSAPIGAKFSESPDRRGTYRKLKICEAFDVVRQEGALVNLSKENCVCAGGRHVAGWQTLARQEFATFLVGKVYESEEVAEASVSKQPQPVYRGKFLILGPLDRFESDPDAVLFFANPAQADRIIGLASFKGSKPFTYYPATSVCSVITNALAKDKIDINLVPIFERRRGKWSQNELVVALPFKDFPIAVESIPHSGFGKLTS